MYYISSFKFLTSAILRCSSLAFSPSFYQRYRILALHAQPEIITLRAVPTREDDIYDNIPEYTIIKINIYFEDNTEDKEGDGNIIMNECDIYPDMAYDKEGEDIFFQVE